MDPRTHAVPGEAPESEDRTPSGKSEKEKFFIPSESKLNPPLTAYESIKGEPYTVQYFGLQEVFQIPAQFDVEKVREKINAVENFIKEEIASKNLIDSVETYNKIMISLRDKLKIPQMEKTQSVFQKIFRYISRARGISAFSKTNFNKKSNSVIT